jgi:4-amino-4-deoxy-L-arabinose transferase-like glycosyltransferase
VEKQEEGFTRHQVSNLSLISNSTEANRLRILSTEWLAVLAIYFFAVLIRYAIFIVTPYWSGDEFVYKTIASGIWQYGQHGVLTDTQISHSVDIPNLLYPYLISPAFILGENFYFGIRFINSIVINMAIFPCYLIARKFLTRNNAIVASTIALAIPFINIGAFAVTEVLFFPLFLLSVWIAIESNERPHSVTWFAAFGIVAAILLNVRLNALVLLPTFLISFFLVVIYFAQTG